MSNIDNIAAQYGGTVVPSSSTQSPDALAAQFGGSLMQAPPPQEGLGSRLLKGAGHILSQVETPFISVGAAPVQLLAKALGKPDPYAGGVPSGIPGMPEKAQVAPATPEGFLVKAGQAGQIATLAVSPEISGIKGLAMLGGASGLANTIAEGNNPITNPSQVIRDTVYNSLFGAGLGVLGGFASHVAESAAAKTGVVGYVKNEIQDINPGLLKQYIDTAQQHGGDIRSLTPSGLAEKAMEKRAGILLDTVIPQAGKAVGAAKEAARNGIIALADETGAVTAQGKVAAQNLFQDINEKVGQMTGHTFGSIEKTDFSGGRAPVLAQLPGRAVELTTGESDKLQKLQGYLDGLMNHKPTIGQAQDTLTNLDNLIGKAWNAPDIGEKSPVIGALKYARGAINRSIAPAAPELAQANEAYGALKDLEAQIGQAAGKNLQHASLFMRRVLSGDKSTDVIPILDQLDAVVTPHITREMLQNDPLLHGNLVQHAIVSDWAKRMFGDASAQTLFEQRMTQRAADDASSLVGLPKQFARKSLTGVLNAFTPDIEKYAMSVSKGQPYSMNPAIRGIDKIIDSAAAAPIVGKMVQGMKDLGLSAHDAEGPAKALFKAWLINRLTQPKNYTPPGGPNSLLPQGVGPLVSPPQDAGPVSVAPTPQGRTLSIAAPAQQAINNTVTPTSGQQFSSQARQLGDFGMNMNTGQRGLRVT